MTVDRAAPRQRLRAARGRLHDTHRYQETISASHNLPIGQVIFIPREEVTLVDGTAEEIEARHKTSEIFFREKAAAKVKTPYGLEQSPHYLRKSREKPTL